MERPTLTDPDSITQRHIDIRSVLLKKNVRLPAFAADWLERLLHLDEINYVIYNHRRLTGVKFAAAFLGGSDPHDLHIGMDVVGAENIPAGGRPIFAGNHPLGGPDGVALIAAIGQHRSDIRFPVNDFLMHIPGLAPLFIPIDKVNRTSANARLLEKAFGGDNSLLYFPAGICSRKQKDGTICDLEWKPTFVKKAVQYGREIVPFYFDAQNRPRFYNLARLRERMGIRFNFEMALLPAEMYAQSGKRLRLVVGRPLSPTLFDSRHTPREWAQLLREHCYRLKEDPEAPFQP